MAVKNQLRQSGVFILPENARGEEDGEHFVRMNWIRTVPKEEAKWKKGIFYYRQVYCSLDERPELLEFLELEFGIPIKSLLKKVDE